MHHNKDHLVKVSRQRVARKEVAPVHNGVVLRILSSTEDSRIIHLDATVV